MSKMIFFLMKQCIQVLDDSLAIKPGSVMQCHLKKGHLQANY